MGNPVEMELKKRWDRHKAAPATAFTATDGELTDLGDQVRDDEIPVRIRARSGWVLNHWLWGRIIHDFAGMRLTGAKIPIDYGHDRDQVLGYLEEFDTSKNNLDCRGKLLPLTPTDRASEVASKGRRGQPWQASIYFGDDEGLVEEVKAGEHVEVNGGTFNGPGLVWRKWTLRGVAIAPYGYDWHTSAKFTDDQFYTVQIVPKEDSMSEEGGKAPVENEVVLESPTEGVAGADAVNVEPAETPNEPGTPQEQCAKFIKLFGERGGVWFAEGKSLDEAYEAHIEATKADAGKRETELAEMKSRIVELEKRLAESQGELTPVSAGPGGVKSEDELDHNIGSSLARAARGKKLQPPTKGKKRGES